MKIVLFFIMLLVGLAEIGCIRPAARTERPSPPAVPTDSARGMSEPYDAVQLGGDVFEAELGVKEGRPSEETFGYRVQIAAVSDESSARALQARLTDEFKMPVYLSHEAPFWFVRLGDFRTMAEAEEAKKDAIQKGYAGARVVEDKIAIGE
jgi:cell division septation protein DedD